MKKFKHIVYFLAFLPFVLFSFSQTSAGGEMGDVMKKLVIAGDDIFEWFPAGAYNEVDNEFIVFYRISGYLDPDKVGVWMSGINGTRVSYKGEVIGEPIATLTQPGTLLQAWSKPAYNPFQDQYMISFVQGQEDTGWDLFALILDAEGNNLSEKISISAIDAQTQHPFIVFNPLRRVYFITWDDNRNGNLDNNIFGIMLNEDGSIATEEFVVSDAPGQQIFTDMALNTRNGSCLITWEDFRYVEDWTDPNGGDIYGALVGAEGNIIKADIPVCDDTGTDHQGDQRQQHQTYNSKADNYFVVWWDERPATQDGGIYARIINADGTPAGEDFELVDYPNPQIFCSVSYHEKTDRIFAAWDDTRDADPEGDVWEKNKKDIYARWFLPDGTPDGPEIPIETQAGEQRNPKITYNPLMDRFLIAWRNYSVEEQGGGGAPIGGGHISEEPGNVEGMLYGMPSFVTGRVIEEGTDEPIEDVSVFIFSIGTLKSVKTNNGGWFNLPEQNQNKGWYGMLFYKKGYRSTLNFFSYNGEPVERTITLAVK